MSEASPGKTQRLGEAAQCLSWEELEARTADGGAHVQSIHEHDSLMALGLTWWLKATGPSVPVNMGKR